MLSVHERARRRAERTRYTLKKNNKRGLPRFSVYRSGAHIYVQLIDDATSHTLASASSLVWASKKKKQIDDKAVSSLKPSTCAGAKLVGKMAGEAALKAGIASAIFDKGSYRFHGRIKALAEGAQEAGLRFSSEILNKE